LAALRVPVPSSEVTSEVFMHQFKPRENQTESDQVKQNWYLLSIKGSLVYELVRMHWKQFMYLFMFTLGEAFYSKIVSIKKCKKKTSQYPDIP